MLEPDKQIALPAGEVPGAVPVPFIARLLADIERGTAAPSALEKLRTADPDTRLHRRVYGYD